MNPACWNSESILTTVVRIYISKPEIVEGVENVSHIQMKVALHPKTRSIKCKNLMERLVVSKAES